MSNIAIIPARGGSKRIPRKNIKDFLGKPIIAYSIETALESGLFDEVMVSTDDEEIAEVAKKYGANVPFLRSKKNSDDYATTVDVLSEVLFNFKKEDRKFDYGCCIYPTAPFVTPEAIKKGFATFKKGKFDTLFPIVAFSYPVWRGLETNKAGKVEMIWPEFLESRSQDLKKVYHDAGQWYWFCSKSVLNKQQLFTNNSGYIELKETEAQDIDNLIDWKMAEIKYKIEKENNTPC